MSDDRRGPDRDYEVGYRKPPTATRWQKGRSGNPAGSSKKARARKVLPTPKTLIEIVAEEALRTVTIRDADGRPVEATMFQAMVRSANVGGLKSGGAALNKAIQLALNAFQAQSTFVTDTVMAMLDHREKWEPEFQRCLVEGEPLPMRFPHPDDVQVNMRTGEVRILGPMCKEELEHLRYLLRVREFWAQLIVGQHEDYEQMIASQEEEMASYEADVRQELGSRGDRWRELIYDEGHFDRPEELWKLHYEKQVTAWKKQLADVDAEFEARGWQPRDAREEMVKAHKRAWIEAKRKEKER